MKVSELQELLKEVSLMEACDLCGVTGYELIDNLCMDCNHDSHKHEQQVEEQQLDEQLWKE